MRSRAAALLSVVLLTLALSCTNYYESQDIQNHLERQGYVVGDSQRLTNTFLNVPTTAIQVGMTGEFEPDFDPQIQFYVFESVADAKEAASRISDDGYRYSWTTADGVNRSRVVEWLHPPTFFQSGDAIAIYLGESGCIRSALSDLMGVPFAGNTEISVCARL